jgi:AraC-like DNA-binding protein
LVLWNISFINKFFSIHLPYLFSYNLVWINIPVFIFIVSFFSLKQPEIFRVNIDTKENNKKEQRIDNKKIKEISIQLEHLMLSKKLFLNSKLNLVDLAKELNTSTNNLSWLLNNIYNSNFYDFVNSYRIAYFIEKIRLGQHQTHTILALSIDSGFNSKSTFNKAFKDIMKETPSSFIKKNSVSIN